MKRPVLERCKGSFISVSGSISGYLENLIDQWLLVAPRANPGMLEMFRDRDCPPFRNKMPWAGEFAGKYLTGAVQVMRVTGDVRLKKWLKQFVAMLVDLQADDGYLGPWSRRQRLTNKNYLGGSTWDSWGHYHIMMGLLLWHEETGDRAALRCTGKIADLMCRKYLGRKRTRLVDTGSSEMNLAPVHALAMLYRKTGKRDYLRLAEQFVVEFSMTGKDGVRAGDYFLAGLNNIPFPETPKPRWESLHPIMGLAELYWITGNVEYAESFQNLWWSMLKGDRHNNGGFTSGEKATGNPYLGAIETCCTIAWMAMSVEMLKLTGNSIVADELELSTWNSVLGMHSASGRWATYNTPMNGTRAASAHQIVFQSREGTPELNCCSVNSARGFGLMSDWALMRDDEGLVVNWYGPCEMKGKIAGINVRIVQNTEYPVNGNVSLRIMPQRNAEFSIKFRIPHWSEKTRVSIDGEAVRGVRSGTYLNVFRKWRKGETVKIRLDMQLRGWQGGKQCRNRASLYRGPLLLAFDQRYNLNLSGKNRQICKQFDMWGPRKPDMLFMPVLDADKLRMNRVQWKEWLPPILLLRCRAASGETIHLCDYASAGETGSPYISWLPFATLTGTLKFSPDNPLRSRRIG